LRCELSKEIVTIVWLETKAGFHTSRMWNLLGEKFMRFVLVLPTLRLLSNKSDWFWWETIEEEATLTHQYITIFLFDLYASKKKHIHGLTAIWPGHPYLRTREQTLVCQGQSKSP
jgi:hypothetical protein